MNKYLAVIYIFVGFLAPNTVLACTFDGNGRDYYITFFNPYTATYGNSSFVACFLDDGYNGLEAYYLPEPVYNQNLAEWQSYTQNKATTTDIQSLIYDKKLDYFEQLLLQIQSGKIKKSQNSFENFLIQKKDIEAVTYLILAKKSEAQTQTLDPWANPPQQRDSLVIAQLLDQATQKAKTTQNPFLKLRYAFQAVKMAFYLNKTQPFFETYNTVFEPLISKNPNNPYCVALAAGYAGGMYIQEKKYDLAALNYAQLFVNSPENRFLAVQNFDFEPNIIKQALKTAQTPQQKLTLLLLADANPHGMPKFTMEYLQEMLNIDPNSPELAVALARKINEIERNFLSPYTTANLNTEAQMVIPSYLNAPNFDIDTHEYENSENTDGIWQWLKSILNKVFSFFGSTPAANAPETNNELETNPNSEQQEDELATEANNQPTISEWKMEGQDFITELQKFTQKVAESGKVKKTDFWYTAAAYLSYLLKNEPNTQKLLQKIPPQADSTIIHQKNIITALLHTQKGNADPRAEQDFYAAIQGFSAEEKRNESYHHQDYSPYDANKYSLYNCFLVKLAQNYLSNNNLPKAILCFEKANQLNAAYQLADLYATQNDLGKFQELLNSANKNEFEKFLTAQTSFNANILNDVQGTKFLRNNDPEKALQKFEKIPANYWKPAESKKYYDESGNLLYEETDENNIVFKTSTETNVSPTLPPNATQYNKLTFAKKIIELQKQNTAESYLKIGNLYSNTPFWGYCGSLWKGGLWYSIYNFSRKIDGIPIAAYPLNIPKIIPNFLKLHTQFIENEYGVRKLAINYYQQAIQKGANPELAAECAALSNFATKNPHASFNPHYYKDFYFENKADSIEKTTQAIAFDTAYLAQVKKYQNTQFFKHLIDQCPTFTDF